MAEVGTQLALDKERQEHLTELRKTTLRKIDFLLKRHIIDHAEAYQLTKEFFQEFLEKRYEFTMRELRQELKKVYISNMTRKQIDQLLDAFEPMEYASVHYSKEQLQQMLTILRQVVDELVKIHTGKRSLIERLRLLFNPEPELIVSDLPATVSSSKEEMQLHVMVEKCYIALDQQKLGHAKTAYHDLLKHYETFDDDHKKQFYPLVHQTYTDLMHRAKMQK